MDWDQIKLILDLLKGNPSARAGHEEDIKSFLSLTSLTLVGYVDYDDDYDYTTMFECFNYLDKIEYIYIYIYIYISKKCILLDGLENRSKYLMM